MKRDIHNTGRGWKLCKYTEASQGKNYVSNQKTLKVCKYTENIKGVMYRADKVLEAAAYMSR